LELNKLRVKLKLIICASKYENIKTSNQLIWLL